MSEEKQQFTPALGDSRLTPLYDFAIAALTRENTWRSLIVEVLDPKPGERILDVGCGTGSLITRLKTDSPLCHPIGVDPDEHVLMLAKKKTSQRGFKIEWHQGFLTPTLVARLAPVDKVVSSLVFHQTPVAEKKSILASMWEVLRPGGILVIADYGLQRTKVMRSLFRLTVQVIDGVEDTTPNAEGKLQKYMLETGFENVSELYLVNTPTGSISVYRGTKPV